MHFDHINALRYFPDVDLVLHRQEYDGWVERVNLPAHLFPMGDELMLSSFDRGDLGVIDDYISRGKVAFNADGEEVLPGVTARLSGAHSPGNQWFSVETSNGTYVVAQDAVYWYSNVEEMWPSGYTNGDTYKMVLATGRSTSISAATSTGSSPATRCRSTSGIRAGPWTSTRSRRSTSRAGTQSLRPEGA